MKMLLIDAGNSRLKWAWLQNGHCGPMQQQANHALRREPLLAEWADGAPASIHVACVAPAPMRQWLEQALPTIAPTQFYRSPAQTGSLINAYRRPADLGVDRWCAMLAVPVLGKAPFVLADCGTALTLDGVDQAGRHLGGSILIGPDTALRALHQRTSLPLPENGEGHGWLNDNTENALLRGQWQASASAIRDFLHCCEKTCGQTPQLFLAGGGSATLAGMLGEPVQILEQPVLTGLYHWIRMTSKG